MPSAQATITAEVLGPAKLMSRLAKHWAHKFEVELGEAQAVIPFPAGRCVLRVDRPLLQATVEADDPEVLAKLENVVADHLVRMAKEPLEISWQH
ncbi:DUF2218 domain-containing protein [Lysobacter sp. F6437]|uniref:DUF2218 domain-containing protein n=1 Tax=Lysobacter sp. F6437 TaxID=3459296 RepID=UPI00403E1A88